MLREEGIKCRIVSVPSEGLFRRQPKTYQRQILPAGKPKFGMTAGLPCTLEGLVGADGEVWGLNSFGFSAPYKVLEFPTIKTKAGGKSPGLCHFYEAISFIPFILQRCSGLCPSDSADSVHGCSGRWN